MPDDPRPRSLIEWLGVSNAPNWRVARPLGWFVGFILTLALPLLFFGALVAAVRVLGGAILGAEVGLGTGGLIVALLGAPFLIWSTILKQRNTDIQHRLAELSDASHFNDKIAAATDGLSARHQVTRVVTGKEGLETVLTEWRDDLVTRAAAIDRLEGLAAERPSEAPRIARMLTIYLRELSRTHPAQDHPRSEWLRRIGGSDGPPQDAHQVHADTGIAPEDATVEAQTRWARGLRPVRPDMERAAQTLGRLRHIDGVDLSALTFDLRGANLQGFDLSGLDFTEARMQAARMEGANLAEARMEGADLVRARMEGANLRGARMVGANLRNARIVGADLVRARMEGANLRGARMEGAFLMEALMEGAKLEMARMERAYLMEARMDGAGLGGARMEGADLMGARMVGARLWRARMEGANLMGARMEGAEPRGARMEGANLWQARFDARTSFEDSELRNASWRDVDLSMVRLSQAQIDSTFGDGSVILPQGLTRPAHWPAEALDPRTYNTERDRWRADPAAYSPPNG